jgi:hypothetical protein
MNNQDKCTISEAIRLSGVARQTFYKKYLDGGLISIKVDERDKKFIELVELFRVFPHLKLSKTDNEKMSLDAEINEKDNYKMSLLSNKIESLMLELHLTNKLLEDKTEQLDQAKERETWLVSKVDHLTDSLKKIEHKPSGNGVNVVPKRSWLSRLFS